MFEQRNTLQTERRFMQVFDHINYRKTWSKTTGLGILNKLMRNAWNTNLSLHLAHECRDFSVSMVNYIFKGKLTVLLGVLFALFFDYLNFGAGLWKMTNPRSGSLVQTKCFGGDLDPFWYILTVVDWFNHVSPLTLWPERRRRWVRSRIAPQRLFKCMLNSWNIHSSGKGARIPVRRKWNSPLPAVCRLLFHLPSNIYTESNTSPIISQVLPSL